MFVNTFKKYLKTSYYFVLTSINKDKYTITKPYVKLTSLFS